jgi:cation/acetate symporter
MRVPSRLRTPNPHLGAYYAIVASAFVSLVIMLAMFEQLGLGQALLAQALMIVPLALYLLIAAGARTQEVEDFFASGRRVPAIYNGFVLAAIAVGGVGFVVYTGTIFFLGFDALAIGLGWVFGLLAASILFVPYLRKAGSYTLPSFLGHRFRSRSLRVAGSVMQLPPAALLLAAELKIAALIAAFFLPASFSIAVLALAALIAAFAILGGMRALTWTGSAQFLVGAVGLTVVVTTVSIVLTNLPAPQLTYGEMFPALHNAEVSAGATPISPGETASELPGAAPLPALKPFLQPFGALSPFDFATLFLCLAFGMAALPSLLVRSGLTGSLADQRRASAWGLLFVALFVMTAPAVAAFAKLIVFRDIALTPVSSLPGWFAEFTRNHLLHAGDANGDGAIGAAELFIGRDGIVLALPAAAGLPYVLSVLMAAAALAVALAASASHLFTLAASLAEDVYRVLDRRQTLPRLVAARAAIAASALAAAIFLVIADLDPLKAALLALAFAGATFFPTLLLAIWWRRCTKWGAMAAMSTGFAIMVIAAAFGAGFDLGPSGISTPLVSLIGILLALAAGIGVSFYLPPPAKVEDDYCEEMRDPGGETIYDRAKMRAAATAAAAEAANQ